LKEQLLLKLRKYIRNLAWKYSNVNFVLLEFEDLVQEGYEIAWKVINNQKYRDKSDKDLLCIAKVSILNHFKNLIRNQYCKKRFQVCIELKENILYNHNFDYSTFIYDFCMFVQDEDLKELFLCFVQPSKKLQNIVRQKIKSINKCIKKEGRGVGKIALLNSCIQEYLNLSYSQFYYKFVRLKNILKKFLKYNCDLCLR